MKKDVLELLDVITCPTIGQRKMRVQTGLRNTQSDIARKFGLLLREV